MNFLYPMALKRKMPHNQLRQRHYVMLKIGESKLLKKDHLSSDLARFSYKMNIGINTEMQMDSWNGNNSLRSLNLK